METRSAVKEVRVALESVYGVALRKACSSVIMTFTVLLGASTRAWMEQFDALHGDRECSSP